jgi:hypothetical protein
MSSCGNAYLNRRTALLVLLFLSVWSYHLLYKQYANITVEILNVIRIVISVSFNYTTKLQFLNLGVIPSLKFSALHIVMMTREGIVGERAILFGFYFGWKTRIAVHGLNTKNSIL